MIRRMGITVSAPLACFLVALVARFAGGALSLNTGLNPYTQSDVIYFAATADQIATLIQTGALIADPALIETTHNSATYRRWGFILAPFWILPGSNVAYATTFVALLGSFTVYNVARIAECLASPLAAVFAALPIALYPSFVFVHTAIIRDAAVLFCLTTITMLVITRTKMSVVRGLFIVLLAAIAVILRPENLILISLVIAASVGLWIITQLKMDPIRSVSISVLTTAIVGIAAIPFVSPVRDYLLRLRDVRFEGRTRYAREIPLETPIDALVSGTSMGIHFILTPFPWMIEGIADIIIFAETVVTLIMLIAAIAGANVIFRNRPVFMGALLFGFIAGIIGFGLGTANVGTAVRHRQTFLWVLFIFGGAGLATLYNNFSNIILWKAQQVWSREPTKYGNS